MLRLTLAVGLASVGFHAFLASLPLALLAAGHPDALIGAVMGVAALVQVGAAFVAGGLIDRFGGRLALLGAATSFLAAALLLASGFAAPDGPLAAIVLVRVLQGIGLAAALPAAMSLVPGIVGGARVATALAIVGVAANVSLAASPAISLAILDASSLQVVATVASVVVALGIVLAWPLGRSDQAARAAGPRGARTFHPAWRRAWSGPLALSVLFVAHWGVVTGYLPQRAAAAGADVALFFTADAIALVLTRVPSGMLVERVGSRWVIVAGIVVTVLALAFLLPSPTTPLLVIAGVGTGVGGALILPPSHLRAVAPRGRRGARLGLRALLGLLLGRHRRGQYRRGAVLRPHRLRGRARGRHDLVRGGRPRGAGRSDDARAARPRSLPEGAEGPDESVLADACTRWPVLGRCAPCVQPASAPWPRSSP